jgi:hypothetical protein
MKKVFTYLIIIVVIVVAIIVIARLSTPEDTWLCVDSQWVKHGNPFESMPTTGCGPAAQTVNQDEITDFESCAAAGNPIMESYPRQCRANDQTFTEVLTMDFADDCLTNNGTWLEQYQECEYIGQTWCDNVNGEFKECESACRHDPAAELCTLQCVPVCEF